MTYQGHIANGAVVLDQAANLPEGARVTISLVDFMVDDLPEDAMGPSLYERLLPVIGMAKGLPADASQNVDHYLYGAPKS